MVLPQTANRNTFVEPVAGKAVKIPLQTPIQKNSGKRSSEPIKSAVAYADWNERSALREVR
jgi:hypothetical protein